VVTRRARLQARVSELALRCASRRRAAETGGRTGDGIGGDRRAQGGRWATIGVLRVTIRLAANPHIEFAIATRHRRGAHAVMVASADAVIAIRARAGTLAEMGFAKTIRKANVASIRGPKSTGSKSAENAGRSSRLALKRAASNSRRRQ